MAVENGIPLDDRSSMSPSSTIEQIDQRDDEKGTFTATRSPMPEPSLGSCRPSSCRWSRNLGGFASYHAHFDKAYLISMDNLRLGQVDMQKKWALYKHLKENYTFEDLVERIGRRREER